MILHTDKKFLSDTIRATSEKLNIKVEFIEKDYWITLALKHLANSQYATSAVFKGGTSLSKGYNLINRFSTDIDIAIIDEENNSGNKIKTIIRTIEKEMTKEMEEINVDGITSKGSMFRKSVFEYESIDKENPDNRLMVEINSFANPFPFQRLTIKSFVFDFFTQTDNNRYVEQYNLQPFEINVLNKEQTLLEKLVSLIRFSFDANVIDSISKKIRHFYDLYFLLNDPECAAFVSSSEFKTRFHEILNHDKKLFDEPLGWQTMSVSESPLILNFVVLWQQLKNVYQSELTALSYSTIPNQTQIAESFNKLITHLK